MQLTDEQKQAVTRWVAEGSSLSDVQRRLREEFALSLTYLDVRFLVIELGLTVKERKVDAKPKAPPPAPSGLSPAGNGSGADDDMGDDLADDLPGAGAGLGVSVEVDRVQKPGALVSGTVVFSDGVKANWMLDQMGRLALDAGGKRYTPSQGDIQAFQMELRLLLERRGY